MEFNSIHKNRNLNYKELGYKYVLKKQTGNHLYPKGIELLINKGAEKFFNLKTAENAVFGAIFAIFQVSLRLMSTYCKK